MNRYKWFQLMQFNFATPASPAVTGGDTGGGGTATPGAGGGGTPGGGTPAPAAPAQINWDSAPQQLREGYNKLKADFEKLQGEYKPWQGLNVQPSQVTQFQQGYQQVYGELKGIADRLQINEAEVADAIKAHGLLPVLDQLRHEMEQAEAAQAGDPNALSERDLQDRIESLVTQRLSPIEERENMRLVTQGNTLVENTISDLAATAFKTQGLDWNTAEPDLKNFVLTGVTEALKYDDDGMRAIKFEGKLAPIQKAFQTFQAMWDAAYIARRKMEGTVRQAAPARPGQQPPPQKGKQPGFDEMIDNPDIIRTSQGKATYAT